MKGDYLNAQVRASVRIWRRMILAIDVFAGQDGKT